MLSAVVLRLGVEVLRSDPTGIPWKESSFGRPRVARTCDISTSRGRLVMNFTIMSPYYLGPALRVFSP